MSGCTLEEGVDQVGELVCLWAGAGEELVDRERLALRPAIDEIAERLGKLPNALYQARSRINARLREWLES